jgi:hypothetical protein
LGLLRANHKVAMGIAIDTIKRAKKVSHDQAFDKSLRLSTSHYSIK